MREDKTKLSEVIHLLEQCKSIKFKVYKMAYGTGIKITIKQRGKGKKSIKTGWLEYQVADGIKELLKSDSKFREKGLAIESDKNKTEV